MKVIICGDREVCDLALVDKAVKKSKYKITLVINGDAKGADTLGKEWAEARNIPVENFPADWKNIDVEGAVVKERFNKWTKKNEKYNANAGFQRNSTMVDEADAVIALQPNGPTNGTQDTIKKAKAKGIPIFVLEKEDDEYEYFF
jgi:hypothetical protein